MSDQISCQVDSSMGSFSEDVQQFVSFTQDPRYLAENIDVLFIGIDLVWGVGRILGVLSTPVAILSLIYWVDIWVLMSSIIIIIVIRNVLHTNLVLSRSRRHSVVGVDGVVLFHLILILCIWNIHGASFGEVSWSMKMASLHVVFRSLWVIIH